MKNIASNNNVYTTRATSNIPNDTILYIVNFPNNDGSAIISADNRIPETVLAIIDQGNINSNEVEPYLQADNSDLPENFSFYNAEIDDYYVSSNIAILAGKVKVMATILLESLT